MKYPASWWLLFLAVQSVIIVTFLIISGRTQFSVRSVSDLSDVTISHGSVREATSVRHKDCRDCNKTPEAMDQIGDNTVGMKELRSFDCFTVMNNTSSGMNITRPRVKPKRLSDKDIINVTSDCRQFRREFGYERYPKVTAEELDFPLAFNILLYKEVDQLHFLLRAIYRPHNSYCLHVDGKSRQEVYDATSRLAACFPNVFLASRREDVVYAGFSRLQADLNCMKDHLERPLVSGTTTVINNNTSGERRQTVPWRYLINLPSQEFPLKTNIELVRILKSYNGSNNINYRTSMANYISARFIFNHTQERDSRTGRVKITRHRKKNRPPPFKLRIAKGLAYNVFSRDFVNFTLADPRARELLEWMKWTYSPDEFYWSTMQYNAHLQAPGGKRANGPHRSWLPDVTWIAWDWMPRAWCHSHKVVRNVCVFGVQDLPHLVRHRELFANKFYMNFHPETLHCLDVWLVNRTRALLAEGTV